jgi:hypothetical protein
MSRQCHAIVLNSAMADRSKCGIGTSLGAVEFRITKLGVKHLHKRGAFMVKKTINALACALFAPLAVAQTSTRTTEQTTATQPTMRTEAATASPSAAGTVTTYEPGKLVVVGSESAQDTFSFVLDKTVRYFNRAGRCGSRRKLSENNSQSQSHRDRPFFTFLCSSRVA